MKECPFCESTDLVTTSYGIETYAVLCNGCGAEGPTGVDEKDAAEKWEDR
jgi:Lar family restriction alleviation protein